MANIEEILLCSFAFVGIVIGTACVFYLWFFAIAFLINRVKKERKVYTPSNRFVFIVPAHNEENDIESTVSGLLEVDYPEERFEVLVVADNCTDKTAEKALAAGARCLERENLSQRGKGHALRLAFSELLKEDFDAFVVVDADSIVSADFLLKMDGRICSKEHVIQAYYGLSNPEASILTYLFQVGSIIENKLFWSGKQIFGLPIFLRGNGMCFTKEIIEKYSWDAFSIVEDTEYGIKLIENGIRIEFAPEIGVYARQPETLEQAFAQRVRWASGNTEITKKRFIRLILDGIITKNLMTFDLGISLLVNSKPLLLMGSFIVFFVAYLSGNVVAIAFAGLLLLMLFCYGGLGILLEGVTSTNLLRLLLCPFYLLWFCAVSFLGLLGFRKNAWVRTNRQ